MANNTDNLLIGKIFPAIAPDNQTANGNLKTLLFSPPTTRGEANAALNHITGQFIARQTSVSQTAVVKRADEETQKTVGDFYKEILEQQPFDAENLAKKKVSVMLDTKMPVREMTLADYEMAKDRAIFKQAGYAMLTDKEIQIVVTAIESHGAVNHGSDGLDKLRRIDNEPGAMFIATDQATIEYAKRAGQAVLQYQEYQAKQSDANQEKTRSETNQMLLDPLRLGGNVPFRWTERILNMPHDLVQQIDKGEIMPGSSTAKWIGEKIAEQITGQPAPKMPTISESVENLTGAKLPSIPEIELERPFEYQTEKYKREAIIGEDVVATAIDLFLLKRGIEWKNPKVIKQEPIGVINPALRRVYENKVKGLTVEAQKMRQAGQDVETIARTLHAKRRQLGIEYKDLTPPDMLKNVFDRNMRNYGDKWGPSIDYLRTVKGKTWEQIIESACRPGGKDLGF
ncbi:MAG: hypothetical protein M3367_02455 [Acidobacteriota bacterium]|nr:hypothetical protein [Acidobacteriota bacterium]